MYFIQHLLLNLKLIQQISQILSYITIITKFNCTFKNTVIIIIIITIIIIIVIIINWHWWQAG